MGGICCKATNSYFINCANLANLSGKWQSGAGGILGNSQGDNYIYNSYNIGNIELINGSSYASTGGIVGYNTGDLVIENCYNIGLLKSSRNIGAIVGNGYNTLQNCYHLNNLEYGSGTITENNSISINEQQLIGKEQINGKLFVDILNEFVITKNKINDILLLKWYYLNEYPTFE